MRLFVAVHFSPEVKAVLLGAVDALRRQAVSGNFTRPENLPLTLAFIGETSGAAAAKAAVDSIALPPFELAVSGFGHFGDLWWAGIEKNKALSDLAEHLQEALRARGFDIERRAFKPHITLARQVALPAPPRLSVPPTAMTVHRNASGGS